MSLFDAQGNPITKLSDKDLLSILQTLNSKIEYINHQSMQIGLYTEFIVEHLLNMRDLEGNPILDIDMTKFPAFAEERFKMMQQEVQRALEEEKAKKQKDVINLNE